MSLTEKEADRRVRNYSLGMRQRLGIATALIGDPAVLILDEPANGLDPAGIRWMRDLLREYADQGGTVLLSSHLLHEIEVIADDLVVIGHGRIVAQGTKQELLSAAGHGRLAPTTSPAWPRALADAGIGASVSGSGALHTDADTDAVGRVALAAGVALTELRSADSAGLEEMFLELTAESQRETIHRRSSSMTTLTATTEDRVAAAPVRARRDVRPIPISRVIGVELRKMFDTRSGFWLMASIGILAVLATGRDHPVRPRRRARPTRPSPPRSASRWPSILPMIAILSVTSEWSQRSGLTTFTLVPQPRPGDRRQGDRRRRHRRRVDVRRVRRSAPSATSSAPPSPASTTVWDIRLAEFANIVLANVLGHGDRLHARRACIRNSAGAIVGYFVYSLLLPTASRAAGGQFQDWFRDLQPWVDFNFAQSRALRGRDAHRREVGPARRRQPDLARRSRSPSACCCCAAPR